MNKLFNEQYALLQEDLEEITNPYERAHIRALLLNTLVGLAEDPNVIDEEEIKGKDAIRNDIAKPIIFEEEVVEVKETPQETIEDIIVEDGPIEIDLDNDPNVVADETPKTIIVDTQENGQVDVTEAYNLITNFEGTDEEKLELATNITLYNLTAVYESLSQLKDCHNKMMLAYYMGEFGLEEMNSFVAQLTDDTFNDVYEFVSNDNLEGLIINIESAIESSEE